ncbi:hypothetical protein FHS43_006417 [Streptosporangium becharense]|uniref:DUF11 domain-containing protein n=1 Tax=Streptosporangium becharense TaxID=1816182 RepID=A0A7W9IM30_9ACTN|nr:hypothetical protein [Streptosporangium becharense]MBB2915097.1 hypothetical protein [Streptosporangium becharense]MBB5822831.1 hypothetical protein [Streptosporangium becharense]
MRSIATRLTAAAVAAALGGSLLVQNPAAAVTVSAAASPADVASSAEAVPSVAAVSSAEAVLSAEAVSPAAAGPAAADFRYEISFPKHVRRGQSLVFTVKVRNRKARGQHYVALVGDFPGRFRRIKVISKPRSVKCGVKRLDLSCWITSLDRGDSTTVRIRAWAGTRRGTATVRFGALVTEDAKADLRKLTKKIRRTIKAGIRIR